MTQQQPRDENAPVFESGVRRCPKTGRIIGGPVAEVNTTAATGAARPQLPLAYLGKAVGVLVGMGALVWFLLRVIPKPSRATYPCQRAAFPIATGFIVWLLSAVASVTAFRMARVQRRQSRWLVAAACTLVAVIAGVAFLAYQPTDDLLGQIASNGQPPFSPTEAVNSPMGVAFGIKPGRVAWAFDPKATSWDGTTDAPGWWADTNTHPEVVTQMLSNIVRSVGDASTDKDAWNKIFTDFNQRKGKGAVGYKSGEKVVIKLNLNQCREHTECGNASYIAPQLVQALLRQLVNDVGVAPANIACYDAIRQVPSTIFNLRTQFAGVRFIDSLGTDGREKAVPDFTKSLTLTQDGTKFFFPTCVTEAQYMINVAGLKGHTLAGMTVTAKNHLGSVFMQDGSAGARNLHPFLTVRSGSGRGGAPGGGARAGGAASAPSLLAAGPASTRASGAARGGGGGGAAQPMGAFNGLVELNGHEQTGGKTILYIVDALYATQTNETRLRPECKWQSAPFNGNWTASLFASQDQVAIDSVALDFLRNEPSLSTIVTGAVDNYLHEMAMANQAPSKTAYDPEKDGKPLQSMGVHEHWNNTVDRKYTRNLGTGAGIELVNTGSRPVL